MLVSVLSHDDQKLEGPSTVGYHVMYRSTEYRLCFIWNKHADISRPTLSL